MHESKIVHIIRICLIDGLFDYLAPNPTNYITTLNFAKSYQSPERFKNVLYLMRCSKSLCVMLFDKFIRTVDVPFSSVKHWDSCRLNKIRRLVVTKIDENDPILYTDPILFCNLKELSLNISPMQFTKFGLPENLTKLTLGEYFVQPLDTLPKNLTYLAFDISFNRPITKNILPETLEDLELSFCFNQPIEKYVLPESLLTLKLGHEFNQPLGTDVLPKNLTVLIFRETYNIPLASGVLPDKLTHL